MLSKSGNLVPARAMPFPHVCPGTSEFRWMATGKFAAGGGRAGSIAEGESEVGALHRATRCDATKRAGMAERIGDILHLIFTQFMNSMDSPLLEYFPLCDPFFFFIRASLLTMRADTQSFCTPVPSPHHTFPSPCWCAFWHMLIASHGGAVRVPGLIVQHRHAFHQSQLNSTQLSTGKLSSTLF